MEPRGHPAYPVLLHEASGISARECLAVLDPARLVLLDVYAPRVIANVAKERITGIACDGQAYTVGLSNGEELRFEPYFDLTEPLQAYGTPEGPAPAKTAPLRFNAQYSDAFGGRRVILDLSSPNCLRFDEQRDTVPYAAVDARDLEIFWPSASLKLLDALPSEAAAVCALAAMRGRYYRILASEAMEDVLDRNKGVDREIPEFQLDEGERRRGTRELVIPKRLGWGGVEQLPGDAGSVLGGSALELTRGGVLNTSVAHSGAQTRRTVQPRGSRLNTKANCVRRSFVVRGGERLRIDRRELEALLLRYNGRVDPVVVGQLQRFALQAE